MVINVGRQEHQKGQVLLVEAFSQVLANHPGALLLIVGRPGAATKAIETAIADAGLGGSVRLLGPRSDVADLLCAADVFAMSSLFEGLGGVVLEAMALNVTDRLVRPSRHT